MNDLAARYNVPGLERGLRLLQLFNRTRRVLSASDIGHGLGVARSTAFRLAHTLERMGYLERTGEGYRIGPGVLRLGFEYIASLDVSELGRRVVERLRDETGYSAQLAIRDRTDVVIVVKAAAPSLLASSVTVGTRLPAHATILGRILLAELDDETLRTLYPRAALAQVSERAPRTLAELKKLLRQDAARGYAVSESFFETGISAIGAPVRDHGGRAIAAMSVVIQRPRLEPRDRDALVKAVLAAAADLSRRLA